MPPLPIQVPQGLQSILRINVDTTCILRMMMIQNGSQKCFKPSGSHSFEMKQPMNSTYVI